jgi:putative membrane protein
MAYMMDYMWGGNGGPGYGFPFFGMAMVLFWLVVFIAIAYLVYKDANSRGMNGLLWFILVIIPMIGILFLIVYLIIRESGARRVAEGQRTPIDILKERYAKGEVTSEQFQKMSEDLKK